MESGFSLGSNTGDRLGHLSAARKRIESLPGVKIAAVSPVYETEPVGVRPEYQHLKFLNAVIVVESPLSAHQWYETLRKIENDLGRKRSLEDRYAPRPIDIDIIFVGNVSVESGGLVIPHPRWAVRRFVVQPLADVRPDLILPGNRNSVKEVLAQLGSAGELAKFAETW